MRRYEPTPDEQQLAVRLLMEMSDPIGRVIVKRSAEKVATRRAIIAAVVAEPGDARLHEEWISVMSNRGFIGKPASPH